jgi:serine/threonine protein kinase
VLLYHLLSGAFPFWPCGADELHGLTATELRDGVVRGSPLFLEDRWGGASPLVKDLLVRMLEKDPRRRLTAAGAAGHQWFAEVLGEGGVSAARGAR